MIKVYPINTTKYKKLKVNRLSKKYKMVAYDSIFFPKFKHIVLDYFNAERELIYIYKEMNKLDSIEISKKQLINYFRIILKNDFNYFKYVSCLCVTSLYYKNLYGKMIKLSPIILKFKGDHNRYRYINC